MENVKEEQIEDVQVVGMIDLPKIDLSKYEGKKVPVELVQLEKGEFGYYYKVSSLMLEQIGSGEKKVDIRATTILGLHQSADGKWGWGEGSKTHNFLKKHNVTRPEELKGKDMVITLVKKNDSDFLRLN